MSYARAHDIAEIPADLSALVRIQASKRQYKDLMLALVANRAVRRQAARELIESDGIAGGAMRAHVRQTTLLKWAKDPGPPMCISHRTARVMDQESGRLVCPACQYQADAKIAAARRARKRKKNPKAPTNLRAAWAEFDRLTAKGAEALAGIDEPGLTERLREPLRPPGDRPA